MADLTLQEYAARFAGLVCRWDNAELAGTVDTYNHSGGWMVSGFEMPQWISMRCPKCGYDWSLNKLPVLHMHKTRLASDAAINAALDASCTGPCVAALMPGEVCPDCGKVAQEEGGDDGEEAEAR